jgi:hypothetical protein
MRVKCSLVRKHKWYSRSESLDYKGKHITDKRAINVCI